MKLRTLIWLVVFGVMLSLPSLRAEEEQDLISVEEKEGDKVGQHPRWDNALKEKYGLTDQQIADLRAKGLGSPQIAISAQLAKSSGKPMDEILKMRLEDHMGWGKIAKELGIPPKEIGQSVAGIRREMHKEKKERREARQERRENKAERRENKQMRHENAKGGKKQ